MNDVIYTTAHADECTLRFSFLCCCRFEATVVAECVFEAHWEGTWLHNRDRRQKTMCDNRVRVTLLPQTFQGSTHDQRLHLSFDVINAKRPDHTHKYPYSKPYPKTKTRGLAYN